ncbi:MAG: hypothetical protein DWQ07_14060 [Chloroflexi bacterium]|nr:MAG: hypothetical protein DWQ07_14060 [Chloroflexota bacterium]
MADTRVVSVDPNGQPWKCKCGRVLGVVVREGKAQVLKVLREPMEALPEIVPVNLVNASLLGQGEVLCRCGRKRKWVAGAEHLERVLELARGSK